MTVSEASPCYVARLKVLYREVVVQELKKKFNVENPWALPRLSKIVINVGVGQGKEDLKYFEQIKEDLSSICGQLAQTRRAKKSIASFKLRKGQPIGLRVTLRGDRMWEFFDRLVNIAFPRIRDFRGLESRGLDRFGHLNLGLKDHHIFPEVNTEKSLKPHGMNITFVIANSNQEKSQALLELLGMPFRKVLTSGKK